MSETILASLGISAGILNLIATIPYIRDILKGNTKPERATWWVWFVLALVGFFAQRSGGARWSLILALTSLIVAGITATLSIHYGYGRFHYRDTAALIVTALGVIVAFSVHSPLVAVATVAFVDAVGGSLTLYKTWYAPRTENFLAWKISTVGVMCGFLAVGQYHPAIFLSPLCNLLVNISMVSIILHRRPKVLRAPADV